MNFTIIIATLISLWAINFSKPESFNYSNKSFKVEYEKEDGKLNGLYTSFYKNGNKKAQGLFKDNLRTGIWVLWNKDGELCTKREYFSNGQYKSLVPAIKSESTLYLTRNTNNYYDYKTIVDSNIIWSKRIWRTIGLENNSELFENNALGKALTNGIQIDQLHMYDSTDDEMKTETNQKPKEIINQLNGKEIIGFAIKEDVFFDKTLGTNQTRIIALAPVIKNHIGEKLICWFYYPEIRKTLARELINASSSNSNTQSLEDIFFFRNFASVIIKENNAKNSEVTSEKTSMDLINEQMRIETDIIESEHTLWLTRLN